MWRPLDISILLASTSSSRVTSDSGTFSGGVGPVLDSSQSNQATYVN